MKLIAHQINTISQLKMVSNRYGCEIDIRARGSELILHHDPFKDGEKLTDFLDAYQHGLLILNIKEAGIEKDVIDAVKQRNIPEYFLLDVEFPFIYRAARSGIRNIAIRFSEDEPIGLADNYAGMVDWVWIDTISRLPIEEENIGVLSTFQTCLVCPERWGRPQDIIPYRQQLRKMNFTLNAVMTNLKYIDLWEQPI